MDKDTNISSETLPLPMPKQPRREVPGVSPAVVEAIEKMERGEKPNTASGLTPAEVRERRARTTPIGASPKTIAHDATLREIVLPSNFEPYEFKQLFLKPLTGRHMARFRAAADSNSFRMLTDAVTSLMEGATAADLTQPDFDYLLYNLRVNSFTRKPFTHTAMCYDEKHFQDVFDGKKPESSLETISVIDKTNLEETPLDSTKLNEKLEQLKAEGLTLEVQHPIVGDSVEQEKLEDALELSLRSRKADAVARNAELSELRFLAEKAKLLSRTAYGSLENRINIVRDLDPDSIAMLEELVPLFLDYGVKETLTVTCGECGAKIETTVQINALSFL